MENIINIIRGYFGDELVSIIVFGMYAVEKIKPTSDIDFLIILNKNEFDQDLYSRELKKITYQEFPLVAFNIYAKDFFIFILNKNPWFALTLHIGYKSYFDLEYFFRENLNEVISKISYSNNNFNFSWELEFLNNSSEQHIAHLEKISLDYLSSAQLLFDSNLYIPALNNWVVHNLG